MRKLEEFVIEKLKVSNKYVGEINLVDFVNCDNLIEYEALLETLRKEIKETATLAPIKQGYDKLYTVVDSVKISYTYSLINEHSL